MGILPKKVIMIINDARGRRKRKKYLTHHPCTGKMQLFQITRMFVEERGKEVVEKGLYQNFCFHLANLQEFSLFSPHKVLDVTDQLQRLVKEHNLQKLMFET